MKRFAIMAVLGAMLCGSLVAGCGGGDTETTTTESDNGTKTETTVEKDD